MSPWFRNVWSVSVVTKYGVKPPKERRVCLGHDWPALSLLGSNEAEWSVRKMHRREVAPALAARKAEEGLGTRYSLSKTCLSLQLGPSLPAAPSLYESMNQFIQSAFRLYLWGANHNKLSGPDGDGGCGYGGHCSGNMGKRRGLCQIPKHPVM